MSPVRIHDLLTLVNEASADVLQEIRRKTGSEELEDRRLDICLARLGLAGDGDEVTLQKLGKIHGITRERIRQIESAHIKRLALELWRRDEVKECLKEFACGGHEEIEKITYEIIAENKNRTNVEFFVGLLHFFFNEGRKWKRSRLMGRQSVAKAVQGRAGWLIAQLKEHKQTRKIEGVVDRLREAAVMFGWSHSEPLLEFSNIRPQRHVSTDRSGVAGKFFSEKNEREIEYESYAEYFLYQILERSMTVDFYTEQPLSIPYKFEGISANYYPDVLIKFRDGKILCVESKDPMRIADAITLAKAGAASKFLYRRNIGYCLVSSRLTTIFDIIDEGYSPLDNELLPIIESKGVLRWGDVRSVLSRWKLSRNAVASFILRNRLFHSKAPFKIRKCSDEEREELFSFSRHV